MTAVFAGKIARHPAVPRKRGASELFGADSFPKIQLRSKLGKAKLRVLLKKNTMGPYQF